MAERKRSKSEERTYSELLGELHQLSTWNSQEKLKREHIPSAWHTLDREAPCKPRKTKLTISLDEDMVRWFRSLGTGYQPRMNAVLRLYMLAVLSKEIERESDRDWKGDPL
ncbi:MAG: BrnA antitoxin family protein [Pseudomonadota bacterium]